MQKCRYCGAELPENPRFCGKCGGVQNAFATDAATTSSNIPPQQSWAPESDTIPASLPSPSSSDPALDNMPTWPSNGQVPGMLPPVAEDEDEHRRGIPPWSSLSGVALGVDALLGQWALIYSRRSSGVGNPADRRSSGVGNPADRQRS